MMDGITFLQSDVFCEKARSRMKAQGGKKLAVVRDRVKQMALSEPEWAQGLLEKAEREYRGDHILPGTGAVPLFVGDPPEWKKRPVTDKEYVWCLNRMEYWNDFIIAYYMTGDKKYALKMKKELLNWIKECPPPDITTDLIQARERFENVNPWRTLEAGIRMFQVWPDTIKFLAAEELLDDDTLEAVAGSVYQHGVVLYHIPPMLWPEANHNHYLMENLGLLYLCNMFPDFSSSLVWSAHANEQLIRCADKQLTADGAQMEGCPTYHNLCMHYFCLWILLSAETGFAIPEQVLRQIEKGLDYSMASFRPCGGCVPWGDSDGDYSAVKAAVLGYQAFHKDKWIMCLKGMTTPEKLKRELFSCIMETNGMDILQLESNCKTMETLPLCSIQRQINQVSYRTSWRADAYHVQFGCQMPNGNGHAHIDPLSFDFSARGRSMLADPGRFTYDEANDRELFKSAAMHNCLLVDGKQPYEYLSSWRFGPQHDGCILKSREEEDCFWTQGIHTCYFPIIHNRLISLVKNCFLLIWDRVEHMEGSHDISLYFHVNEEKVLPGAMANSYVTAAEGGANLYICSLSKLSGKLLPGFVSEFIDVRHPSTRICYEDLGVSGRKEYVTLAVPFKENIPVVEQCGAYYKDGFSCIDLKVNGNGYQLKWDGEDFELKEY